MSATVVLAQMAAAARRPARTFFSLKVKSEEELQRVGNGSMQIIKQMRLQEACPR